MNTNQRGLYQGGTSGVAQACELQLVNGNLYVYLMEQNNKLVILNVKQFNSCAFQGSSLIVFFGKEPVQTIEIEGALATSVYNDWAGIKESDSVKNTSKTNRLILWIGIFALLFFILSWFYFIPWIGEKSVTLIPVDLEISMGEGISENIAKASDINDSASFYAGKFLEQLEMDETYPISVKVIESKELNAFALPGGKLFIYSALLDKMNSSEELVALLGHEITHVTHRHSLKSICRSAASSIVLSTFFGDAGGITSSILSQVDQFKSLDYSRDLETEADLDGLKMMIQNEVNPQGMLRLLQILKEASQEEPGMMKYLSTHPDTEARIAAVISNIKKDQSFSKKEELESVFNSLKASL